MYECDFCGEDNHDVIDCDMCNSYHCYINGEVSCKTCIKCKEKTSNYKEESDSIICGPCFDNCTKKKCY
jgi:hypothetical protein